MTASDGEIGQIQSPGNGTVASVAQASMPSVVAITTVSVQEIPSFFGYGRVSTKVQLPVQGLS